MEYNSREVYEKNHIDKAIINYEINQDLVNFAIKTGLTKLQRFNHNYVEYLEKIVEQMLEALLKYINDPNHYYQLEYIELVEQITGKKIEETI
jgi:hypothetical protein